MKLEKITTGGERHYEDACGTAHALDLIGERWTLLVMRELMLGPRRFSDLRASLPGISANVLTQRLKGLEAAGVAARRKLEPPASVHVYELTAWGREAEPVILWLGRWGARSPFHDETMPLSAVSMALSFKAMFDPARAAGLDVTVAFRADGEVFTFAIADGALSIARGRGADAEAVVSGPPGALVGTVYGFAELADLERAGTVEVEGDRSALSRFSRAFCLPAKAEA